MKLGRNSIIRLIELDPLLIILVSQAIKETGIDFFIPPTGGLRSAELQNQLFKKGRSKCDGYLHLSRHQSGQAVDLVPWVDGKAAWDEGFCSMIAGSVSKVAAENGIEIEWGGDWKDFPDFAHFQLVRK